MNYEQLSAFASSGLLLSVQIADAYRLRQITAEEKIRLEAAMKTGRKAARVEKKETETGELASEANRQGIGGHLSVEFVPPTGKVGPKVKITACGKPAGEFAASNAPELVSFLAGICRACAAASADDSAEPAPLSLVSNG
jgi:hypothetical protein